jgi:hypothetical protein
MSKAKKTFDVHALLTKANDLLEAPKGTPEFRRGVYTMLEGVLQATGNYAGFGFIEWSKEGGYERWAALNDPNASTGSYLGDETRRFYHYSDMMSKVQREIDPGFHDLYGAT